MFKWPFARYSSSDTSSYASEAQVLNAIRAMEWDRYGNKLAARKPLPIRDEDSVVIDHFTNFLKKRGVHCNIEPPQKNQSETDENSCVLTMNAKEDSAKRPE